MGGTGRRCFLLSALLRQRLIMRWRSAILRRRCWKPLVSHHSTTKTQKLIKFGWFFCCRKQKQKYHFFLILHFLTTPMIGAKQADFIGHSQGGVLPRYWVQYQGGKGKMHSMIGLSAINHGTSWQGLAPILEKLKGMVKLLTFNVDVVTKAAPALQDIMNTSKFVADLNAHGDTLPDVFQANIVTKYVTLPVPFLFGIVFGFYVEPRLFTRYVSCLLPPVRSRYSNRYDEIVSPYKSSFQSGPGVVNVVLQDLCASAYVEHTLMVASKTTLRWILNQLDPSTASPANCNPKF